MTAAQVLLRLSAVPSPSTPLARSGCVYVGAEDFKKLEDPSSPLVYVMIRGFVCVARYVLGFGGGCERGRWGMYVSIFGFHEKIWI